MPPNPPQVPAPTERDMAVDLLAAYSRGRWGVLIEEAKTAIRRAVAAEGRERMLVEAEAAAMALVMSHEGTIVRLEERTEGMEEEIHEKDVAGRALLEKVGVLEKALRPFVRGAFKSCCGDDCGVCNVCVGKAALAQAGKEMA